MKIIDIEIPNFGYHSSNRVRATAYIHDEFVKTTKRVLNPVMIVCPGGGYHSLSERNKEPVILKLLSNGYQVILLEYSLLNKDETKGILPQPLLELGYTINWVYEHKDNFYFDVKQISAMGFSAGGHLCATYNGVYHQAWFTKKLGVDIEHLKLKAIILCYPVISLLSDWPNENKRILEITDNHQFIAADQLVSNLSFPCFIWHTVEDQRVSVNNSLLFIQALHQHHIIFEAHLFQVGEHGLSLADEMTATESKSSYNNQAAKWFDLAMDWLHSLSV